MAGINLAASPGSAGTNYATVYEKLRLLIDEAARSNPVTAQPLLNPTAWVTLTAYLKGNSVSKGGQNYYAIVGGTSGATGPTGTGNGAIVDGTVTWYYAGPSFTDDPNAPTTTLVPIASQYPGTYFTPTNCTSALGSSQIRNTANFLVTGGVANDGGGASGSLVAATNSAGSQYSVIFRQSFWTDSPAFQIVGGNLGSSASLQVFIDNVPLTVAGGDGFKSVTSISFLQLVFASRKPRLITLEGLNSFFGILHNDTTSKVWAANPANSVRFAIVGTSYIAGSGVHPVTPSLSLGAQIGKLLGATDIWADSLGSGSGYAAFGGVGPYITRLPQLIAYGADVVIVTGGGVNDRNTIATPALEQATVATYLAALRAGLPGAIIIVVGSEAGASGPAANILTMELAASQAVAAIPDRYMYFRLQSGTSADTAWISGTGTTAAPDTTGNSDLYISADAIHPVQAGVGYLAQRHAAAIGSLIKNIMAGTVF